MLIWKQATVLIDLTPYCPLILSPIAPSLPSHCPLAPLILSSSLQYSLPGLTRDTGGLGTRPCSVRLTHLTGHAQQEVPKFTVEGVGGVVGGGATDEEMGTRKEGEGTGSYGRMVVVRGLKNKCIQCNIMPLQ